jgi:hypothetical protein
MRNRNKSTSKKTEQVIPDPTTADLNEHPSTPKPKLDVPQESADTSENREKLWTGYCRLGLKLDRRDELSEFKERLQNGNLNNVTAPELMSAAMEFVIAIKSSDLKMREWSPPPTKDELNDLASWIERRLEEERATQRERGRHDQYARLVARAEGKQPHRPSGSSCTIAPAHLQRSKLGREELERRFLAVAGRHQRERGEVKREWFDPNSKFRIKDADISITNKQLTFLANAIVGSQEKRSFDETWAIVHGWYTRQRATREKEAVSSSPTSTVRTGTPVGGEAGTDGGTTSTRRGVSQTRKRRGGR